MNFPEQETLKYRKFFRESPLTFRVYCVSECIFEQKLENKAEVLKKYIIKNQSNFVTPLNLI